MQRQSFKVVSLGDRHSLVKLSDRIAIITRALKRKGKKGKTAAIVAAYFGFHSRSEAQQFVAGIKRYFPRAYCQIRVAERLNTLIEVKIRGFEGLEKFTWALLAKPEIVTPQQSQADISPVEPSTPASNVIQFDRSNAPVMHRSTRPLAVHGLAIE